MKKILLIEDEKQFSGLIKMRLEASSYEVFTAEDGEKGLAKARDIKPDIVICDLLMPKKGGFEVLNALRHDLRSSVPFIMLTCVGDLEKVKKAYDNEADFYLTKPVDTEVLLRNIRILLSLSESRH